MSLGRVTIRSNKITVQNTPICEYPQRLPEFKGSLSDWKAQMDKWYENLVLVLLRNYGKDGRSVRVWTQADEPDEAKDGDVWGQTVNGVVTDSLILIDGEWFSLIGPQGETGETGAAGRGVHVYEQAEEPAEAMAGDIWIEP